VGTPPWHNLGVSGFGLPVMLDVGLGCLRCMVHRVLVMPVGKMGMMCCRFVGSFFVVLCGFLVVPCRVFVMLCCLVVMLCCLLRH
jgi:hypothetical protein